MKTQICKCCGVTKHINEYEHQKDRPNPRKVCKRCRYNQRDREKERERHRIYMRKRRNDYPTIARQQWERSKYGKTKEDFGISECEICGSEESLCIDHCHNSGEARGILCSRCNAAIGLFKENEDSLLSAIAYLNRFKD